MTSTQTQFKTASMGASAIAPAVAPIGTLTTIVLEIHADSIPEASSCRLRTDKYLLVLKRERDGEAWVTWEAQNLIEEHGVGATTEEAVADLWQALCGYYDELERDEARLGNKLRAELDILRKYLHRR